jgi:hypothetical protein
VIPSVPVGVNKSQRQLLKLFAKLDKANQQHVLAFMEFLASRHQSADTHSRTAVIEAPVVERPENESVIGAIKRLSKSYSMVDKDDVLHETSDLMTSHVLKGRPAGEVIDELEMLFYRHYQKKIQPDSE